MLGLNRQDCGCRFGLELGCFPGFAYKSDTCFKGLTLALLVFTHFFAHRSGWITDAGGDNGYKGRSKCRTKIYDKTIKTTNLFDFEK